MSLDKGMKDEAAKRFPLYDKAAQTKENTVEITKNFQLHAKDTGSSEVQVALLSNRIGDLSEHMKMHRKDKHSQHSLLKLVSQRKKLLKYLARTKTDVYKKLTEKLSLRR